MNGDPGDPAATGGYVTDVSVVADILGELFTEAGHGDPSHLRGLHEADAWRIVSALRAARNGLGLRVVATLSECTCTTKASPGIDDFAYGVPHADCDVHGQPSVAYDIGFAAGRRDHMASHRCGTRERPAVRGDDLALVLPAWAWAGPYPHADVDWTSREAAEAATDQVKDAYARLGATYDAYTGPSPAAAPAHAPQPERG